MLAPALPYKATAHYKDAIVWNPGPHQGWMYYASTEDLDTALIEEQAARLFESKNVYFVPNRRDGRLVAVSEIVSLVATNIDMQDLWFWSEDLTRAAHFNQIGVFRLGVVRGS